MINRLQASYRDKDKGFTLVELLVVIVIIGILAGIAIPLFLNQREKGVEAGIKSDLKNTATLQETYFIDANTYAANGAEGSLDGFQETADNTITIVSGDASAFCLKGENAGADNDFYYDSDGGGLLAVGATCA